VKSLLIFLVENEGWPAASIAAAGRNRTELPALERWVNDQPPKTTRFTIRWPEASPPSAKHGRVGASKALSSPSKLPAGRMPKEPWALPRALLGQTGVQRTPACGRLIQLVEKNRPDNCSSRRQDRGKESLLSLMALRMRFPSTGVDRAEQPTPALTHCAVCRPLYEAGDGKPRPGCPVGRCGWPITPPPARRCASRPVA